MAFTYPVSAPITQYFGVNPAPYQPQGHYGVDFGIAVGTDVRAIGDGTVVWSDWSQNMGTNPWMMIPGSPNTGINVMIDHGVYVSVYAHLDSTPMNNGQFVKGGAIIGKSGNTGLSTGPHLHLELIYMPNINGYMYGRVDPLKLMSTFIAPGNVTPLANQRLVGLSTINQRKEANSDSAIVRIIPPNTIETFTGYVIGEKVTVGKITSNIWYKDNQGYVWAGGFTEQSTKGLNDLTPPPPLADNQRRVGMANVNQRKEAKTDSPVVRIIKANTVETFTGYVVGQKVTVAPVTSDIWYKDAQGVTWAGGFTDQSTKGLKNLTPVPTPPPAPVIKENERRVGPAGAIQRSEPKRTGTEVRNIPANTVEVFSGFVRGENVSSGGVTSDLWYKDSKGFVWAGGFTEQVTRGLVDQTPVPVPVVAVAKKIVSVGARLRTSPTVTANTNIKEVLPAESTVKVNGYVEGQLIEVSNIWFRAEAGGFIHSSGVTDGSIANLTKVVTPDVPATDEEPPYEFKPDFDFVEYLPANTWNMQNKNFPANPEMVVIHQYDARANNPSIEGVINHFQTPRPLSPSSAHFVVSGKRIVQMVGLTDRAFHAGPTSPKPGSTVNGNDYIGIEVDPDEDPDTVASVRKLLTALNKKYNKTFKLTKHRDVPNTATECGTDIHLEKYANLTPEVPVVVKPVPEVPVTPPVVVKPEPVPEVPVQRDPTPDEVRWVLDYLIRTTK